MAVDIEHRSLQANGIRFHIAVAGKPDGPPIFCLHGFPEGWMSWRPLMEQLAEARIYAPDLRGYPGSERPAQGYDVFTLTDDIRALIVALGLERPLLVSHDWGGALGWIFAHRYSHLIRGLVVINCPHPRTLVRAVFHGEDLQPLRIPWLYFFQIPWLPERLLTTALGRAVLRLSFLIREGRRGTMDRALVGELVARFQTSADLGPAIDYYRAIALTHILPARRRELWDVYARPIAAPTTVIWGTRDGALSARVALASGADAGCDVEWRPLPGVGHFVSLEASSRLAAELRRLLERAR
jgi:pimeloyl-ACP methyl ester carboxylesterase